MSQGRFEGAWEVQEAVGDGEADEGKEEEVPDVDYFPNYIEARKGVGLSAG